MGTKARDFSRSLGLGGSGNVTIADILPFLTTANVVEIASANLYFTNARVFTQLELANIDILADVDTRSRPASNGDVLVWNGYIWAPNTITALGLNFTTDEVPEGNVNLYYTNARVRSAVGAANPTIIYDETTGLFSANLEAVAASANTTDSLPEGFTNQYYTNARVFANIQLASLDDLRDVEYEFYANTPEPREVFSNGPFLNAVLVYKLGEDSDGNFKGAWIPGDAPLASVANTVLTLFGLNSDDLAEGANNLYFTNLRAELAVANTSINVHFDVNTSNNLAVGRVLGWTGYAWEPFELSNISGVGSSQFANFAERSNVANVSLFTVTAGFAQQANVANTALRASFANFAELANSVVNASVANTVATLFGLTTDNLAEGANNLYYTNARVTAKLSETSIDVLADVDTTTLPAAYGDVLVWDGYKWIPNNISQSAINAGFAERANVANTVLSLAGFTSDDVTEGEVNYYYTLNRLNADIQTALVGKDILLDDLIVAGDLTVRGNSVILNVSNLVTQSKILQLSSSAEFASEAEGSGIIIAGANAQMAYAEATNSFNFNKNLVVAGNILPAAGRVYNLGSFDRPWRGIFLNASTMFLGNLAISQGPDGGMQVTDINTGELAGIGLANITATQTVTVDRIQGNSSPILELNGYLGGNVLQYTNGKTGNVYFGIMKNDDLNKFAGMRVVEKTYNGSDVESDVIFYTDKEGFSNSVPRLALEGTGNIVVQGNVTVNGNTLVQIARTSISTATSVVANYANTNQASLYNQETGIITVNKDGVYEATAVLTLTDDWQDTPVKAAYIPTGTYVVQVQANDSAVGGGHTQEYYSSVMSWYSSDTNSGTADEIALHRAGAGPGGGTIFLRVQRTLSADTDDLKLQIAGTTINNGVSSYTFKFRRLL